jgi:hypothetical protein
MPLLKDNSIIHLSTNADLSAYTYTQVYAGLAGTITLNGTVVIMSPGSVIDIRVRSIIGAPGIYLIGAPINTLSHDTNLGSRTL